MTNKTVTMPLELAERIKKHLTVFLDHNLCECEGAHICGRTEVRRDTDELRALLAAPAVERQEPVANWTDNTGNMFRLCPVVGNLQIKVSAYGEAEKWDSVKMTPAHALTKLSPLYTSPPAPVAVVLPELTDEQRDIEVTEMADFMNHLSGGLRHFAGYLIDAGWRKPNACLDKVKELNQ